MPKPLGRPPYKDLLTPAEWRTVNAVRHGLTNQKIADLESISLDAVKYHVANAIDKLGLKNRKALVHWVGVPIDSVLNLQGSAMTEKFNILGLGQVARSVKNIEKSVKWYRDILGLTHLYTFDHLAFFDCGGTRLMLSESEEVNASESVLYLRVPNIVVAYEQLQELGVVFVHVPHMIHKHEDGSEEWMAFLEDLEGRPIAIMAIVNKDAPS